uniref:MAD2L1-binding protein-like n=1 Tax=Jaculus jaculus TaxID=51337 RepID=UPI001E1AFBC4|nr:MAD2L1-binding protein-like [Jaculus jaculus]
MATPKSPDQSPAQDPSSPREPLCLVPVVFPGPVTQESCYQLACELLKHVMYQRLQLPMPYGQLKRFWQSPPPAEDGPARATSSKRCQQALAEMESVLSHLADFFARTLVPRVLILLGGNALHPKELYELDLSMLDPFSVDQGLGTAACVRRVFQAIFMADVFGELQCPPLMGTTVMVQGHRDCGEEWFRPKLHYRVPRRAHRLTVTLSCDAPCSPALASEDYIWFQAPVMLKGFRE